MTTTYLMRHARTAQSASYVCSGVADDSVALDEVGREQCRQLSAAKLDWLRNVRTVITSDFIRAKQTAGLLIGDRPMTRLVEPRLNEIDYGEFEGRPWLEYGAWLRRAGPAAPVKGGYESWLEAVHRLIAGLGDCASHPGPRLVVGHGLLISVVRALQGDEMHLDPFRLPEAPYVQPLVFSDGDLRAVLGRWPSVDYARGRRPAVLASIHNHGSSTSSSRPHHD